MIGDRRSREQKAKQERLVVFNVSTYFLHKVFFENVVPRLPYSFIIYERFVAFITFQGERASQGHH